MFLKKNYVHGIIFLNNELSQPKSREEKQLGKNYFRKMLCCCRISKGEKRFNN